MRIIGGDLKGKKLYSVRGLSIRPTADRLRESLFNILSNRVREALVLDLFAGTGALGIEALSRGAKFGMFVDNHKSALAVIERNIRSCALDHRAKLIQGNIIQNLNCIRFYRPAFNLVFIDPPYSKNMVEPALYNLHHSHCLENDTRIVVEHSDSESIPQDLLAFRMDDQRRYGKTLVSFLGYMI